MAVAECRYLSFDVIKSVKNPITNYAGSKATLTNLLNAGFLVLGDNNSYAITVKSRELLKENGFITEHLKMNLKGVYNSHQQILTAKLFAVMFESDYYLTFYPQFHRHGNRYLIPDACLIRRNEEGHYKIEFIEVENSLKVEGYLHRKSEKYKNLAGDYWVYNEWWRKKAVEFRLPFPEYEQFCFCAKCFGKEIPNTIFKWEG